MDNIIIRGMLEPDWRIHVSVRSPSAVQSSDSTHTEHLKGDKYCVFVFSFWNICIVFFYMYIIVTPFLYYIIEIML